LRVLHVQGVLRRGAAQAPGMLKARIEALETEERQLSQETVYESSEGDQRGRGGAVGRGGQLADLLTAGSGQQGRR
jgi:hypothetical protein